MTNIPKHPCAGKCQRYSGEQCSTCLIQDIEKREFELGLAPDDAYVKSNFIVGGKVVYIDSEKSDQLMTITQVQKNGVQLDGNSNFALNHLIRNATPAEHKANRRLSGATYFLGWDLAAGDDQHIEHLVKSISKDEHVHLSNAIKAQREVS